MIVMLKPVTASSQTIYGRLVKIKNKIYLHAFSTPGVRAALQWLSGAKRNFF
jgi:hypothetical protein